jgi:formamidopyrimidine-DNA glycosylase
MPELPEVETIRTQLAERLVGRRITAVEVSDPLLVAPAGPDAFASSLVGQRIASVGRRGKYLLCVLDSGAVLALHLRMTGRLHWRPAAPGPEEERFLRAVWRFDDGATLTFGDARRFGRAWVIPGGTDPAAYWAGRLGVEPLGNEFTARRLAELMRGRRVAIKSALLNQALIAGLGNMYADEALFAARVHPLRPAGALSEREYRALHRAIRDRLNAAIAAGGASIDTYRDGLGQRGRMQEQLRVHLHEGERCPRCGTIIVKTVVGQRGTYWCPRCQPDPTGAPAPLGSRRPRRVRKEVSA